jgi:hypothetical protein
VVWNLDGQSGGVEADVDILKQLDVLKPTIIDTLQLHCLWQPISASCISNRVNNGTEPVEFNLSNGLPAAFNFPTVNPTVVVLSDKSKKRGRILHVDPAADRLQRLE